MLFAVKLLSALSNIRNNDCNNDARFSRDIIDEIEFLSIISDSLLSFFVKPTINLLDQLVNIAKCSHLMFHIYRKHRAKFMTKDLYKDIQSTIQNCFLVVELFNNKDPLAKVYLYQLGTDELESFFGTLRTMSYSKNSDFLELMERIKIALQIKRVYNEHPEWRKFSRTSSSLTKDHSSAGSWTGSTSILFLIRTLIC